MCKYIVYETYVYMRYMKLDVTVATEDKLGDYYQSYNQAYMNIGILQRHCGFTSRLP